MFFYIHIYIYRERERERKGEREIIYFLARQQLRSGTQGLDLIATGRGKNHIETSTRKSQGEKDACGYGQATRDTNGMDIYRLVVAHTGRTSTKCGES